MFTLAISAKGQVTLPKEVLAHLGIGPGEKLVVEPLPGGAIRLGAAPRGTLDAVFGVLKDKSDLCLSTEEISELSAASWAGQP